jgi:hypothetical protein
MVLKIVPYKLGGRKGFRTELNGIPFSRKPVELDRAIQQAEALDKAGKMEVVTEYALGEDDIKKMIPSLNVISYPQLLEAQTIEDVLDDKGRLILLYLTIDQSTGHWVCLLKLRDANIIEYFEMLDIEITPELCKDTLKEIILTAFNYNSNSNSNSTIKDKIDLVYPKKAPKKQADVEVLFEKWIHK